MNALTAELDQASTGQQPVSNSSDATTRQRVHELKRRGMSERAIAKELGLSKSTVHHHVHGVLRSVVRELGISSTVTREDIHKKIFEFAPEAVQNVQDLAQSATKDEVRLKANTDMLDRAGFAPVQKHVTLSIIEEMSREELIQDIKRLLGAPILPMNEVAPTLNQPTIIEPGAS